MHGVLPKPEEILHHVRVHRVPAVPAAQTGCRSAGLFGVRLPWEAAVGNASPAPLRGAHGPSLVCVFSLRRWI